MSQIKQKCVVVHAKHAQGEFEGKPYEFTKLFVVDATKVANDAENGCKVIEYKKKDYKLFDKLAGVQLPAVLELTLDFDGKYMNLVDFEIVQDVGDDLGFLLDDFDYSA